MRGFRGGGLRREFFPNATGNHGDFGFGNPQRLHDFVLRIVGDRDDVIRLARHGVQHRPGIEKCAQVVSIRRRTQMNHVHDGNDQWSSMKKRRVVMRHVQQVAAARGSRNQQLFAQCIDRRVNDGHTGTEVPEAYGIPFSHDGLNREAIYLLVEFLEQISGIRPDSSNQPTSVDCDGLQAWARLVASTASGRNAKL